MVACFFFRQIAAAAVTAVAAATVLTRQQHSWETLLGTLAERRPTHRVLLSCPVLVQTGTGAPVW